jgi:hypothetical protein
MGEKRRRLRADARILPFPKGLSDDEGVADPVKLYAHFAALDLPDQITCPNCDKPAPRKTVKIIVAVDRMVYFSQRQCPCGAMFSIRNYQPTKQEIASDLQDLRDLLELPVH